MLPIFASIYGWLQGKIDSPLCYHGHTYKTPYPLYMLALGNLKLLPPFGTPVANLKLPVKISALAAEDELHTVRTMIHSLVTKLTRDNPDHRIPLYDWDMNGYPPDAANLSGYAVYSNPLVSEEIVGDDIKLAACDLDIDVQFIWRHN